ncbi:MAG: FtsX-like permease family protein [Prolixibacteraceae bacterium]|jgi:lipoprotein-releasing system permease protein|nr:FtsX-like permease family protein [Prolixibacteraceae bacterium]
MNFSLYIARRYLLSKKSKNVVNIISAIAMIGVIVGTTALVVVLSIFNGFDVLIKSFFSVFDSEIKITAAEGKQFDPYSSAFEQIRNDESVAYFCEVAEEIAHFKFEDRQFIANIKGVSEDFLEMSGLDNHMYDGNLLLNDGNFDYAVIGRGMAYNLGASTNFVRPIYISVPKKGKGSSTLLDPFRHKHVFLSGIYEVKQQEVDDQYALVTLDLARELLEMDSTVTSIEIGLVEGADVKRFQKEIKKKLGNEFVIQNRYQQHESYYRVAKSERFFIYLTLSFILVIASFNLASSISMLILDKRKDINILSSLGLTKQKIGLIFLFEGWLVSIVGAAIGLVLGVLICLGQMHYGWLKFPGSFSIEYYPVELRWTNLIVIAITVLLIGAVASWLPVKLLPKKFFQINQE